MEALLSSHFLAFPIFSGITIRHHAHNATTFAQENETHKRAKALKSKERQETWTTRLPPHNIPCSAARSSQHPLRVQLRDVLDESARPSRGGGAGGRHRRRDRLLRLRA